MPELTEEQERVAAARMDARLLVVAGAGTGKTHTLIARLNRLVDRDEVLPGSGILLLSFTRAAVGEIRERLRGGSGEAGFVRARTFDSFATQALSELDPNGSWGSNNYEQRIRAVLRLDLGDHLSGYQHVCVDEIQDLVGLRADLVMKILTEADCGFTLLGDPAQAIYNWQISDDQQRSEGSEALFGWLRETFPQLQQCVLSDNHRARTEITQQVWNLHPELCEAEPQWVRIRDALLDVFLGEAEVIESDTDLSEFATDTEQRTVILCRNNYLALAQSASLRRLRIPHAVTRGASDRCVPKWVAELLRSEHHMVAKARFEALHAQRRPEGLPPVEKAWKSLRAVARDGPAQIRLSTLAQKIAQNYLPDDLNEPASAPLVISTIHRSKGREFENVALLVDNDFFDTGGRFELPEETRVLFVALSRARDRILQKDIPLPKARLRPKKDRVTQRWTLVKRKSTLAAVEIKATDVDHMNPPGAFHVSDMDPVEIQRYLSEEVCVGDPVVLEYISSSTRGEPCVFYRISHNRQVIGVTSEKFGEEFASMLGASWRREMRWPRKILGVHIETVATMGGSEAATSNAGLGQSGLWLHPRVIGLGNLENWQAGS